MITKHTDTYYTNKYGNRFCDEKSAQEDETLRDYCPFIVRTIHKSKSFPNDSYITFSNTWGSGIEGIDDYGKPWTGQINDKNRVYLFKDIISNMQKLIEEFGDNIGFCRQHRGMGHYSDAIVLLEKNEN